MKKHILASLIALLPATSLLAQTPIPPTTPLYDYGITSGSFIRNDSKQLSNGNILTVDCWGTDLGMQLAIHSNLGNNVVSASFSNPNAAPQIAYIKSVALSIDPNSGAQYASVLHAESENGYSGVYLSVFQIFSTNIVPVNTYIPLGNGAPLGIEADNEGSVLLAVSYGNVYQIRAFHHSAYAGNNPGNIGAWNNSPITNFSLPNGGQVTYGDFTFSSEVSGSYRKKVYLLNFTAPTSYDTIIEKLDTYITPGATVIANSNIQIVDPGHTPAYTIAAPEFYSSSTAHYMAVVQHNSALFSHGDMGGSIISDPNPMLNDALQLDMVYSDECENYVLAWTGLPGSMGTTQLTMDGMNTPLYQEILDNSYSYNGAYPSSKYISISGKYLDQSGTSDIAIAADNIVPGNNLPSYKRSTCYNMNQWRMAQEEQMSSETSIYPNPVADQLQINGADINYDASFVVLDILGKEVSRISGAQQIDISNLPAGKYMLRLPLQKGGYEFKSIVKL
jgi:hypothetical protein